jgi:hypothetical protein
VSTEPRRPRTDRENALRRIQRLQRRADYLRVQLDADAFSEAAEGRIKGELSALHWAIPLLEDAVPDAPEGHRRVHRYMSAECWHGIHGNVPFGCPLHCTHCKTPCRCECHRTAANVKARTE